MCVVQRSLKIADACMQSSIHVELFVDILNRYLFLFAEVQTTQFSCTRVCMFCVCMFASCKLHRQLRMWGCLRWDLCGSVYGSDMLRAQYTSL